MARVFISHASEDRERAGQLREWLVAERHQVFLDQDPGDGIGVGDEWEQLLDKQLRRADAVVCVVTSAFLASTWCTYEIGYARSRGSRLLPVLAEPGVVHPLLRSHHHTDLTQNPGAARTQLLAALHRIDTGGGAGWPDDRCPFPGLLPLDTDWHPVFFGRSEEVHQLTELLRSPAEHAKGAVLLVVGPSGCGKSSLVRAGLLPAMAEEPWWRVLAPILPGTDPVAALARELAAAARRIDLEWTLNQVRRELDEGGLSGLADELLLADPAGPQRRLLIVIDQFEELLTQNGPGERARFGQLMRPALGGAVQVVATLRPEFLKQLLVDVDLEKLPTRTYTLRPLPREALRTVIEDPAELAGIGVSEDLVARMVAATGSGEAMPLLAFTLAQLADGVVRGGHLSGARYEQLGGVQGALIRQAEEALAEASADTGRGREQVIAGLLRLVTVDEQGRPTRWRVPRAQLPEPVSRELDAFITRRLVITDTENGNEVVGVAHEAILSAWEPLAETIKENASTLRARRRVEQAATEWDSDNRSRARLWERGQLAAARADIGAHPHADDDLSPAAQAFLHASHRRDRFRRRLAITTLSVLLVLTLLVAGYIYTQRRAAEHQRDVAVSQQVAGQALALRATDPALAAQLDLAAYRLVPTTEARGSLLSTFAAPYATELTGHTSGLTKLAFSPDGHTLATASADRTVKLWDIRDPHHPTTLATLTSHTDEVWSVAFSPDGRTLATGSKDHTARLWDISDPRHPHALGMLTGHTDTVWSVTFSPDGRTLATGSADRTVRLWDLSDLHHPSPLATLTGHASGIYSMAFSPDGHTLATGSGDHTVRLWDLSNPHHPQALATLTGHTDTVWSVAFSPDGHTLATGSADRTARLWDIRDSRQPSPLGTPTGHTDAVYSVAFSPDGHTLATAGHDHTARLWDIRDPHHPLAILTGHTNMIWSVAFSPDGRTLATASADTTARLWDLPGPIMAGHTDAVRSVAFSPDGHTLATASNDTTARLWDVSDPRHPSALGTLTGHTDTVWSVAFSPDGHTLATGSADHTVRLWDVSDPRHPSALGTLTGHTNIVWSVAFSPDGHTLTTASDDHTTRLWDTSDPHQPKSLSTFVVPAGVFAVAFSPNGHTLATGSSDHTARLWDVHDPRQPQLLSTLTGRHENDVYSVAFSLGGHILATGSADSTARLWDISNPRQPHRLGTLTGHTDAVNSVAFSPDGHTLATASNDHTTRLWDVSDPHRPTALGSLTGHTDAVSSVAFSADGHTLATGSADHIARLWDTNVDRVAARICAVTWPAITKNQWNHYLPGLGYRPPCR